MSNVIFLRNGPAVALTEPPPLDPSVPAQRRMLVQRGFAQGYELGVEMGRRFGRPAPLHRRLIADIRGAYAWLRSRPKWELIGCLTLNAIVWYPLFCGARAFSHAVFS